MKYIYHNFHNTGREFTKDDIDKAMSGINNIAFSYLNKDELSLYIQNNQKALLKFKKENIQPIAADEILHFLEKNYFEHLDPNLAVSNLSRYKLIDAYGPRLGLIQEVIKELPVSLLEVSYPVLSLNKDSPITVYRYKYLKFFYPFLINKILKGDFITKEEIWLSFLTEANFNDIKFTRHLVECIVKEASQEDFLQAQLEVLHEHQKNYLQLMVESDLCYSPQFPSVNKQVLNWLDVEIRHCKSKIKNKIDNQSVIEFNQRTKFKIALSVPKLLCVIGSMRESELIINMSLQEMLRAINESFETIGSDDVSVKSLKNKYYALNETTKQETKQLLIQLANKIN